MNTIFKNKGEIDPRSITTFGVSSKEGENPIGFFGTGLKYAIAILLREGCEVTIYSGTKKLEFAVKPQKIRVDSFNIVTMNKKPLGFTTELGKTWELWQAIRELYCNCMDEAGSVSNNSGPEKGYTTIIISGAKVQKVMDNIGQYILQSAPLHKLDNLEIHAGKSEYVFYKGVQIYKLPTPSMYTYNIVDRHLDLTEDRTLKYYWYAEHTISNAISTAKFFFKDILTAADIWFEHQLDFGNKSTISPEFLSGVAALHREYATNLNPTAVNALHKHDPKTIPEPEPIEISKLDSKRVDKAISFLVSLDIDIREYPIRFTEFLGEGVLGQAKNETIYISRKTLEMGTKMLAGTIMEEYFHLKYKVADCTYGMQNFLIDKIMTIGEQLTGEPL